MALIRSYLGRLTIANGGTTSNILAAREMSQMIGIAFDNPAAFTAAVTVQVGPHEDSAAGAMKVWNRNGTDVTLTAAKYQTLSDALGFEAIRAVSAGAEGADRLIDVYALMDIH